MRKIKPRDPSFEKFVNQISPEILETLTDEQIEAIYKAFGYKIESSHPIDLRVSIPIPGLRLYLFLLAGWERRSKKRLLYEKGLYPVFTPVNVLFFSGFFAVICFSIFTIFPSISIPVPFAGNALIPRINDKSQCQKAGREWKDNKCLDDQSVNPSLSSYPTSIPWINSEYECRKSSRAWKDNKCWDDQHSRDF